MSDSFLDHLPSHEREKIRKRLRSPEEYERLRERVKGPEDLESELSHAEMMAEARFALESEPAVHDDVKNELMKDVAQQGMDTVLESGGLNAKMRQAVERGNFQLTVSAHPSSHEDRMVVLPEGNVDEKIPVRPMYSDRYASHCIRRA